MIPFWRRRSEPKRWGAQSPEGAVLHDDSNRERDVEIDEATGIQPMPCTCMCMCRHGRGLCAGTRAGNVDETPQNKSMGPVGGSEDAGE